MVEIICSESGLTFEAASKRSKMHPDVSSMKTNAFNSKDGQWYHLTITALQEARERGGYTTIEEFIALAKEIRRAKNEVAKQESQRQVERENERQVERERRAAERAAENALLKANGYKWVVDRVDANSSYALEDREDGVYFYLYAPDGREVSVQQAIDEIQRGADVVLAEIAAKKETARAAQVKKEIEAAAARRAIEAKEMNLRETAMRYLRGVSEVTIKNYRVFSDALQNKVVIASAPSGSLTAAEYHGVRVLIRISGVGYDDDGYYSFYCVDPDAANLPRMATRGL